MIQKLQEDFYNIFGKGSEVRSYFAPGRVNLIGEHTDYNGGNVFPCAISFGTYAIARKRDDNLIRLYSNNFVEKGIIEISLDELGYNSKDDWANYPKGVTAVFINKGYRIDSGYEVLYYGNIPTGAGLSSSASIELVTSVLLKSLFDLDISMIEMVKLSQKAENEFVGVNCGIMDQFAIGMGRENNAILLDCNTLEYEYCPVELGKYTLVIGNTNKRRGLADSKYNERRSECENALKQLREQLDITALGELSEELFEENKHLIKCDVERRRAKHAVYENQRTLKAVKALKEGNLVEFGKMLNASHISLKDDYEVTGKELDTLVELAWNQPGTIGSRMTGAGFGGCTVSLIESVRVQEFIDNITKEYTEIIGYAPSFYIANIGNGAREI